MSGQGFIAANEGPLKTRFKKEERKGGIGTVERWEWKEREEKGKEGKGQRKGSG